MKLEGLAGDVGASNRNPSALREDHHSNLWTRKLNPSVTCSLGTTLRRRLPVTKSVSINETL
jgi:hypothetical protein